MAEATFNTDWISGWDYDEWTGRMPAIHLYDDETQAEEDLAAWKQESQTVQLARKSHDTPENRVLWAEEMTPTKEQRPPVAYLTAAINTHEGGGLILSGGVGVGKSRLAGRAVHMLRGSLLPTAYVKATVLLDDLRDAATSDERKAKQLADLRGKYATAPALVIDDLGAARTTPFVQEQLTALFDERHELAEIAPLLTIVTTNLQPTQLESYMGKPAFSRLIGLCPSQFVLEGKDLRKEQHE